MATISHLQTSKGRPSATQIIIYRPECTVFRSYHSKVALTTIENGQRKVYLDQNTWDYSRTTLRYLGQFLGLTVHGIKIRVASGEFILSDVEKVEQSIIGVGQ